MATYVQTEVSKSKGHIEFIGRYEYFIREVNGQNELYRAPTTNPVRQDGSRSGRWQTSERFADDYMNQIHLTKEIL